ncbi:MAG: hypothetical protein IVW55_05970 [Chloroflexi bacterium]|nr:hypothetical protein [Chloroflexota bacterium]
MPRWLTRLLIFGSIAIAAVLVVYRFLNQDEDYDDFDDIDGGFEFQETPVEIDVPAEESAYTSEALSGGDAAPASARESAGEVGNGAAGARSARKSHSTTTLNESLTGGVATEAGSPNGHAIAASAEEAPQPTESGDDRGVSEAPHAEEAASARLTLVNGIGDAYANRLGGIGITTLGELAACDAGSVAEQLSVPGGRETVEDWISKAQELIALAARSDTHDGEQQ